MSGQVHVDMQGFGPVDIWLDCDPDSDHDGLIVGQGATFAEAKADAIASLAEALNDARVLTEPTQS